MPYLLTASRDPDLLVQIDARHAEHFRTAGNIAQRYMEIAYSSGATLGVVCNGRERLFGKMAFPGSLEGPLVTDVAAIDKLGEGLSLKEQQSILKELKRTFGGPMRAAMTSVSAAFGNRAVYFVFRDLGPMLIVPKEPGVFRLAAIRMDGARTLEEERMCAAINRTSINAYSFLWRSLNELQKKRDAEVKAAIAAEEARTSPPLADMLDNPGAAAAQRQNRHDEEEDELDDDDGEMEDGNAPFEAPDSPIDTSSDEELNVDF